VEEIGHLYPGNKRPKGRELPRIQYDAILDAVIADGEKVLNAPRCDLRNGLCAWRTGSRIEWHGTWENATERIIAKHAMKEELAPR